MPHSLRSPARLLVVVLGLVVALGALAPVGAATAAVGRSVATTTPATTPTEDQPDQPGPTEKDRREDPGTLTTTVTSSDGLVFHGDVTYYQWDATGQAFEQYDLDHVHYGSSPTVLARELPAGSYYLAWADYDGFYGPAYANGATAPATDLSSPGVITVAAGGAPTATLQLVASTPRVAVSGSVVNAAGAGLPDVLVYAESDDYYAEATTGADGGYVLGLPPGDYTLGFDGGSQYDSTTVEVSVGTSAVTVAPVTLTSVALYSVSGVVSGAAPLAGAVVTLYRVNGTPADLDYSEVDTVVTGTNGAYTFANVRANRSYTIRASADGHVPTWLGNVASYDATTPFTLTADTTGKDVTLPRSSTLSGIVSGPAGPAEDVSVGLYQWDADAGTFYEVGDATTQATGRYSFPTIAPGTYTLYFQPSGASSALLPGWIVGDAMPTGPTAPGVFTVTSTPTDLVRDKMLARGQVATGRVVDAAGTGISRATVVAYVQETDSSGGTPVTSWTQHATATAGTNGVFAVSVPPSSVVTFRFSRGGYTPQFLGGGAELPVTATATNSRTTPATGDLALTPDVALQPFASHLGAVAGQDLSFCRTNALPANDDGSSEAVTIPFQLKFFGTGYSELYVNNNGNVTFGSSQSQYTPNDLTGATARPIIAPFFADVDTNGPGSNVVTYGSSADGNTFCVNWADVGYYSAKDDKLNTFQLLLTRNDSGAGRVAGDFDITFNYDRVQWETGQASGGVGGLGGTSAAVGFSAGTGQTGTYVQLPGSLVNGALLDGGTNALVSSSQNSTQLGRYRYQVRNDGLVSTLGDLAGSVTRAGGAPVSGAYVQACRPNGTGCAYTSTASDGEFGFTALPTGDYRITVEPATSDLFAGGVSATVAAGVRTQLGPIVLAAPVPIPSNVTLTNNGVGSNGVPSVYYGDPLQFRVVGCAGVVAPTYSVTLANGTVVRDRLPLAESPAGTYAATIAPLVPATGDATISTTVPATCGGAPVSFNVYIDPSGVVTDQYGRPLVGATVTLLRSDTENGDYTVVPDGSAIMSPSNRANPSFTDSNGYFRWDVQSGWYKVTATSPGCTSLTTEALEVPPEKIDLILKMTCTATAPVPTTAPVVSGLPRVGSTITATAASWAAPVVSTGVELRRNGVALPSPSYTLGVDDVGATFTAVATGQRPDYTTELGAGQVVTFSGVTATSAAVTGLVGAAPTATAPAAPSGSGKVGTALTTAAAPAWSLPSVATTIQWTRGGAPIAGATGTSYDVTSADVGQAVAVTYTGTLAGYEVATVSTPAVTPVVGDAPVATVAPRIGGTAQLGRTLSVSPGTWSSDSLTFGYQWLRGGSPIAGATGTTYQVAAADVAASLTVAVTATRTGYAPGSATSPAVKVAKVASTATAKLAKKKVKATKRAVLTVKVAASGIAAPLGALVVKDGKKVIARLSLKAADKGAVKITLPKLKKGKHKLVVAYAGSASTLASSSRGVTLTVTK